MAARGVRLGRGGECGGTSDPCARPREREHGHPQRRLPYGRVWRCGHSGRAIPIGWGSGLDNLAPLGRVCLLRVSAGGGDSVQSLGHLVPETADRLLRLLGGLDRLAGASGGTGRQTLTLYNLGHKEQEKQEKESGFE